MARRNYDSYSKKSKRKEKKSKYTEVEKLAFQMARFDVGITNSNSKVYESYQNGVKSLKPKPDKKPLI